MRLSPRLIAIGVGILALGGVATAHMTGNSGLECVACEWAVAKAEGFISSNMTEYAVEAVIDKVCQSVPVITQTCENIVAEYWPYLVNLLLNKETPNVVCQQIKLCTQAL